MFDSASLRTHVLFDTLLAEWATGAAPQGEDVWVFTNERLGLRLRSPRLPLGQAKKWAKREAYQAHPLVGTLTLVVMPGEVPFDVSTDASL